MRFRIRENAVIENAPGLDDLPYFFINCASMTLMGRIRGFLGGIAVPTFFVNHFSPQAQTALAGAHKEAQRMNHNFVGTQHLLLAIMHCESGIAVKVLNEMKISPDVVCAKIDKFVGFGPSAKVTNTFPYTPRVKKALALAGKEASALQHSYVGTQHLLLGLLREKDGVAGKVLENLKLEVEAIRQKVIQGTPAAAAEEWRRPDCE